MSTILALETSCDETACAVVSKYDGMIRVLSNSVSSQIQLHAPHGGVIPNLAAREHTKNILIVLKKALEDARLNLSDIDALAVTMAPGLIPALLVGTTTAQTLSWLLRKPLLGIHHIEGHIYANFVTDDSSKDTSPSTQAQFPLLALVVSGGHTQLVLMKQHFDYTIIGETQDDAVGEAFDKVARILGLEYPGGPIVSRKAEEYLTSPERTFELSPLPRPMLHSHNFSFSFSGLKTAVLYATKQFRVANNLDEKDPLPDSFIQAMCAEFQQSALDVLIKKTLDAIKQYHPKTLILAGGVSANKELRRQLRETVSQSFPHVLCNLSPLALSTDNAAMIGVAAAFHWENLSEKTRRDTLSWWKHIETRANYSLEEYGAMWNANPFRAQ